MNVSSFFQGSVLKFSVTGEGVAIDPETGELSVAATALADGLTVTVTALDALGTPGQPFTLTIAAALAALAPSVLTPPALAGSGRIGEPLTVTPGTWGGQPAPAIALQWLRGGAEIAGETGEIYVPQAADDGQAITCRVTAGNAAGALAAEPGPILVTRTPPVAVAALADVTAEEGTEAPTIDAAAAFAGEGLGFAVTGAGATIDPVSGRLTVPTDAVLDGAVVTVTATNSGGAAAVDFRVTITARPTILPPLLLAAPVLAGAGKIGSALSVDTGRWAGLPEPTLSVQWLRDGVEIAGATGPSYVPVDADDRCALACRVTALSSAGMLATEIAAITATHVAPELVGELFDEIFDQGAGPETVATAQVFSGRALVYAVTGGGATIDPATGMLAIPTEVALSGETVRVTATNSGGSVSADFLLTIEDAGSEFPPMLADADWSASEVRDAAPAGRRRIAVAGSVVVPEGFELRLYSGPQAGGTMDLNNRVITPGVPYTTNGSLAVGTTCHNVLFWRRVADGAWAEASTAIVFEIRGLPVGGEQPQFPAANQTLSAATSAALTAALNTRSALGSTGTWVIHLPTGDYGDLNLNDYQLPGKTILRSANFPSTGAKFRSVTMQRAQNIEFQFINLDRNGLGFKARAIDMSGARTCAISYSDLDFGPNVRNSAPRGWAPNVNYGVHIWRDDATLTRPKDITLYMNYIHGGADCGVYGDAGDRLTIAENVYANIGGDDNQFGACDGVDFINNWGSRKKYPDWQEGVGWKHTDFAQMNTWQVGTVNGVFLKNFRFIGNVVLKGDWDASIGIPAQGIFASKSNTENILYDNNIVSANTPNAIYNDNNQGAIGRLNRARFNTALKVIDDTRFNSHDARVAIAGLIEATRNVQCGFAGAGIGDGLNIVMVGGTTPNYTASRAYYVNAVQAASFYDYRPVAGQPTHWAYDGVKQGAYQRFYDVIVGGKYPKIGPAQAAWKTWYDPRNQITS